MEGDKEFVNHMLDKHLWRKDSILDINITNQLKQSALHICASRNELDILQRILKSPEIEMPIEDVNGRSPLQLARDLNNGVAVLYIKVHMKTHKGIIKCLGIARSIHA